MKKFRYPSTWCRTDSTASEYPVRRALRPDLRCAAASRIRALILIICLTFVPLDLLISFSGTTRANTATQVQTVPLNDAATPQEPNGPIKQQLVREEIRAVEAKQDSQADSKLKQLIEQVRSVRFGQEEKAAASPSAGPARRPVLAPDPNQKPLDPQAVIESYKQGAERNLPIEKVTDQTLQKLKTLAEQPGSVSSPLELGEVLFTAGSLKEAVTFYREALKRIDPNDPNTPNDKPWIMFQIGNCLRDHDRALAAKMYGQLLIDYPQSPWTELARAESKLIEWYLREEPRKLIEAKNRPAGQ